MRTSILLPFLFASIACFGTPPIHDGKLLLFGNLHAHSKLSDDVRNAGVDMLPARAFEYADAHGIDFLAISDHHKAIGSNHRLWMTEEEYRVQLYGAAMTYNASHVGEFVAIPAIEWGNTATGNHVNVFGAEELPPDDIKGEDYDRLLEWASNRAQFVQFNHPYAWKAESKRNKAVGNYGEALFADKDAFVDAVDPIVKTVSVITTVAGGHMGGRFRDSEAKTHRDRHEKAWRHYLEFLNMGFHISPSANQDTHTKNWGTVTAARTAVWADSFS